MLLLVHVVLDVISLEIVICACVTRAMKNATAVKNKFFLIIVNIKRLLFFGKQLNPLYSPKIVCTNGEEVRDELLLV